MNCTCTTTNQGRSVRLSGREIWGAGTVTMDPGYVGLDGRHWLAVLIGVNTFQVPCTEIVNEPVDQK